MRVGFYPKLAWNGIRKNKRLYTPYILTCIGMIMMYYIIIFLSDSPLLNEIAGGETAQNMLGMGTWVIAVFACIFLFYTNSFLIRRRKKEFGLYNILGMGKRNIAVILLWETLIIAAISLTAGCAAGIAFSKLAELGLLNIIRGDVEYSLTVSWGSIGKVCIIFPVIFVCIFLNALRQIHTANPVELLHSENAGEKPPKGNWMLGILGIVLLGAAYYLAVTIREPLSALTWFFVAVIMVIIGTYLLFISGSVLFCRILQKNKSYYYKSNHFVSVSSLVYRMKRNGAGLASICILGTMVLVMLSSTACLYFGAEDSLRTRYPRNISVNFSWADAEGMNNENIGSLRSSVTRVLEENHVRPLKVRDYRMASAAGILQDRNIEPDVSKVNSFSLDTYDSLVQVYIVPLEDYNRMEGVSEQLGENEALLYPVRMKYPETEITVNGGKTFRVAKVLDEFEEMGIVSVDVIPSLFIIVPDFEESLSTFAGLADYNGNQMFRFRYEYGFDLDETDELQLMISEQLRETIREMSIQEQDNIYVYGVECAVEERDDFYGTYGGLFFLGVLLSIVFIFAAVLIIYYKQISEGYEDQSRFEIMQKVGMTKKDIRRSINSQMLTVFFLPLITAGIHLSFAFPLIRKLLMLFNMVNLKLLIATTAGSFLIFAVFYILVYRITSNAYYNIVSS